MRTSICSSNRGTPWNIVFLAMLKPLVNDGFKGYCLDPMGLIPICYDIERCLIDNYEVCLGGYSTRGVPHGLGGDKRRVNIHLMKPLKENDQPP